MNIEPKGPDVFPNIGARVKASVIDSVVIVLLVVVLAAVYMVIGHETPVAIAVLLSVVLGYEPILVWKRGMTIGHRVMGIRVIDARSKTNLRLGKAVLRCLIKGGLGFVSFVWALFSDSQKTLHDLITKSCVINVRVSTEQLAGFDSLQAAVAVPLSIPFVQRSKTRRIAITIVWELIVLVFLSILLGMVYPSECLEDRGHVDLNCQTAELITLLVLGSLSVIVFVFGASGRLPGAKRRPNIGSMPTG